MIIRSKAPLRLGLAGGGTDLSPYCDRYGGAVLNATISLYAYCTIETIDGDRLYFEAKEVDYGESFPMDGDFCGGQAVFPGNESPGEVDRRLLLHAGVYRRVRADYGPPPCAFRMTTYNEAAMGSGLGGSSTMVVAMLKAYVEWLRLPLGEYDIARLAWEIERIDLGLAGGMQDQYAAAFGGFNFMEFEARGKVIVNPLRVKRWIRNELEDSLVLYQTGRSRESARIIRQQIQSVEQDGRRLQGLHELKRNAYRMKEAVLRGDFALFAEALRDGWEAKKSTSEVISNPALEQIYQAAMEAGGLAGKLSGAGGGGFFLFYVEPPKRPDVMWRLKEFGGQALTIQFVEEGTLGWSLDTRKSKA